MSNKQDYKYLIFLLFLLSGISGLVYQIVWTRMLVLVFGNTMLAMSTVLSAFMGGLAAGSFVLGKYIDKKPRSLIKVYAILEAGIGIFALFFPLILDMFTPVYSSLYSLFEGNIILLNLFRFFICFLLIGVPTFLMGGTLPVLIKRFTSKGDSIGYQTGYLYGLNTVGAVMGTFACGYFLLRLLGMQKTTWVAVAINLGVAIVAWYLGQKTSEGKVPESAEPDQLKETFEEQSVYGKTTIRMVLIGIGLSGFCALAYEVFWTRMLNLFLHNNIYSFTAILATFLIGIAIGSLLYAQFLSKLKQQIGLFIWLQIGIGTVSFATPFIFSLLHTDLFNNFNEALTLAKTAVIMIGPTIMMGIAVPLAIQICRRGTNREGTSVGTVYAVNTVGAILGAFIAGFVLLASVGLHKGVIIVASLNMLAGFLPLFANAKVKLRPVWGAVFIVLVFSMFLPASSNLFKNLFQSAHPNADIIHYKEGKVANVLVYDFKKLGYKDFHLNAVNEASSRLWHVQLFKMLGLLPTVIHDNPSDALMVAFGAGMSAGACAINVESLDCVDLNPDISGIAKTFTRENLDVYNRDNFNQIVNDGRNALLLSDRKYSLIISDATNPKMFDSWTLYSQEFYQLVKSRLKPDGIFCQWALIPLPGDAIKVILNTFRSVFPHMSFWVIHGSSQVLMLGTPERLELDYHELKTRLEPLYAKSGLDEFGVDSVEKFLSFFILGEDGLDKMLNGFDKISTDDMPHAQFHIEQDVEGVDQCMDLVRYQESIIPYMKNPETLPQEFVSKMAAYDDIARRLNVGFLTNDRIMFAEAEVIADNAGLDDANVKHHLNHCPEKKRYFKERTSEYPDDFTAHNWLGNIHLLDHEVEQAREAFIKTIDLKPDHTYAYMNLALTDMETGDIDSAVDNLLEAIKLSPNKSILRAVDIQLDRARTLNKLKYNPNSTELLRALGKAYYTDGQILKAVKTYRNAIERSNGDETLIMELARICENHGFIEEAFNLYNRLSESQPDNFAFTAYRDEFKRLNDDTTLYRNWRNKRFGKPASEVKQDNETAFVHPKSCDDALLIWNRIDADGSADKNELLKAAGMYEQSTKEKPEDLHAYIDAATLYEHTGNFEKAASLWEGAVAIRPDRNAYKMHVARLKNLALIDKGEVKGLEKAVLLNQTGNLFRAVSKPEHAIDYYEEALLINPNQKESWLNLAQTSVETGDYPKAVSAAEQALKLDPTLQQAQEIKQQVSAILNSGKN